LHQLQQPSEIHLADFSAYYSQYSSAESREVYLRALLIKLAQEKEQKEQKKILEEIDREFMRTSFKDQNRNVAKVRESNTENAPESELKIPSKSEILKEVYTSEEKFHDF
jgi:hypothetical protein